MANNKVTYNPEPATIRKICAQIRAGWSEQERRRQQMYDVLPVQITETRISTDATVMDEENA